jgi:hypothetical protein
MAGTCAGTTGSTCTRFGDSWARQGFANATLVLDMGSIGVFNGILYAQREHLTQNLDDWGSVKIWGLATNPGAATDAMPGTLGTAQSSFALAQNTHATLLRYDFSSAISGRYIVLQFLTGDTGPANPGGQELRLFSTASTASVPEPSSILLFLLGAAIAKKRFRTLTTSV